MEVVPALHAQAGPTPCYTDLHTAMTEHPADLVIIATPIHVHVAPAEVALRAGASVLVEKPLCGSLEQANRLQAAADAASGFVAVGFQSHYSVTTHAFLADVRSGLLGELQFMKALSLSPRDYSYYARGSWAGALTASDGSPVYDSPGMNARAHLIYHQLLTAAAATGRNPQPSVLEARLLRAYRIQNHDTTCLRYRAAGIDCLLLASHAVDRAEHAKVLYRFTKSTVRYGDAAPFVVEMDDGTLREYPQDTDPCPKVSACLTALRGGPLPPCRIADARAHVSVMEQAQRMALVEDVPENRIMRGAESTWVTGLADELADGYDNNAMPDFAGLRDETP